MRVVVALGGKALLNHDAPMTASGQHSSVASAAPSLAALARQHQLLLSHGSGPQVSLLALQAAGRAALAEPPPDLVGAHADGMIAYLLEQELGNVLPPEVPFATVLTMVEVSADDPAFDNPTKFVGAAYTKADADRLAERTGWAFRLDGDRWRRVVPAPEPKRIVELRPIQWLLDMHVVVMCAGGGGIPTMHAPSRDGPLVAVEAVVDKDLTSELLARGVGAELLVLATDVDGVYADWGAPGQHRLDRVTTSTLRALSLAPGSMGAKVEAAVRFVEHTGARAAVGTLADVEKLVEGVAGTQVVAA